ncbi:MAG: molybdate ABC transporter substrate-binding protein [Deltaproteobacteria bacterium]|nr:molybdate ABC transporter substrate-binding protein [Deltaproteobacteria bacterium]
MKTDKVLFAAAVTAMVAVSISFFLNFLTHGSVANAAEIKVLSAVALRPVLSELSGEFARSTGHKLMFGYDTAGAVKNRIQRGESADLAITTAPQVEELIKQGKIAADGRVIVAKVGVGVAVRSGAAKPDLGSVEAFKRSMLAAKSVIYADPAGGGAAGIHFAQVLERLGIAADMKPKSKLIKSLNTAELVAKGEGELGVTQISLIVGAPGVELAGALPAELQHYTVFSAGVVANAKEGEAARALIKFLSGPAAAHVIKTQGMEPGTP